MKVRSNINKSKSLTQGKEYIVLGIEADDLRLINDQGQPYLYELDLFDVVESEEPIFWTTEIGSDGEIYSYPKSWNETGFFEDFHEGVEETVKLFWNECFKFYGIKQNV